ncbi:MAG TPA: class I SAM-dependent methyltransferase [Spirochaetia bacterium]|nr:class I SAM-dependent methyltransferase [Spirochaetia bacterium]
MSDRNIPYSEYLEAKSSVDDRSLSRSVRDAFLELIARRAKDCAENRAIRFLDAGTGTGAMVRRVIAWVDNLQPENRPVVSSYTGVDADPESLALATTATELLLRSLGFEVGTENLDTGTRLAGRRGNDLVETQFFLGDLATPDESWALPGFYHFLTAHAVFDLFPLENAVAMLKKLLVADGALYATINYDGLTELIPCYRDRAFEERVLAWYDRTMDERPAVAMTGAGRPRDSLGGSELHPAGGSKSGRKLVEVMLQAGFELSALGSSDWVVAPKNGNYPDRERIFFAKILSLIHNEAMRSPVFDQTEVERWYDSRRLAIDRSELVLIVHQIDLLAARRDNTAAAGS